MLAFVGVVAVTGCSDAGPDGPAGVKSGAPGAPPQGIEVPIVRVVDGDTARALVNGREESVRYIGIDTPEVDPSIGVECFGAAASTRNEELVDGETVRLQFDAERRDRYDRLEREAVEAERGPWGEC